MKEYHFYISDDRCHDFHYVHHCFIMFYDNLKDRNIQIDRHQIWSDGCVGQFKNTRIFQWCSLHKNYKVPHMWNYFQTGHGKGEHDGAEACVKTALRREELKLSTNSTIQNAQSIVRWCTSVMGEGSAMRAESTSRDMWRYFFGRWQTQIVHMHGNARLFLGLVAFIRFEALITQYLKFGLEDSLVFAGLVVMVTGCV